MALQFVDWISIVAFFVISLAVGIAVAKRAGQMPKSCRAAYLKATRGKASPRAAIKAHCLECVGWNRQEVQLCTGTACPLWMYRPFLKGGR